MGWISSVMLSFSNEELWVDGEDEPRETCEPLERINAWIKDGKLVELIGPTYKKGAGYGMDANLYGGGFKHFDISGFIETVAAQAWKEPEKLQLWVKEGQEGVDDKPFTPVQLTWKNKSHLEPLSSIRWDLEDESAFEEVLTFKVDGAYTWGTAKDSQNRERIRDAASKVWPPVLPSCHWWAFRIIVKKTGDRAFDIDNVPKLVIDSFSTNLIKKDGSPHKELGLFRDDTVDFVRLIQIYGERVGGSDETTVTIFGRKST